MLSVATVIEYLERLAPLNHAADWDNVGLLLGDHAEAVERIMTCLTVTPETASEAVAAAAQLIVTHHPILFRATKRLTTATTEGRILLQLARAGVAVYSPHTAFDNAEDGINALLARRFGLTDMQPPRRGTDAGKCKIIVFVPEADLARVSDALFAAGAGNIGQYRECSFRLAGTGTFFGSDASQPSIGQKGRREEVSEWRLEVLCPEDRVGSAITAMRRAHSYEEPAFDVYPLKPVSGNTGEGKVGQLPQRVSLRELAQQVKTGLQANGVQLVGDPERGVQRLALVCGAGGEFLPDAVRAGADVLLTGELRFHDSLNAQAQGLALVLPGHFATERCGVEHLAERLREQWPELKIWASESERDPLTCL